MGKPLRKPLRKPIIIEFNGLPGSGKTTVASLLIERLRDDSYEVLEYSEVFRCFKKNKLMITKSFLSLRFIHFQYLFCCFIILDKKDIFNIINIKIILDSFIHFLLLTYFNKSFNKYDFIILDQGITQNWLSINHDKRIKKIKTIRKFNNRLCVYMNNYFIINACLCAEKALDRMDMRLKGTSRLDELGRSEAKRIALVQNSNLKDLRKISPFNSLDLDMKNNMEFNVKKILNNL